MDWPCGAARTRPTNVPKPEGCPAAPGYPRASSRSAPGCWPRTRPGSNRPAAARTTRSAPARLRPIRGLCRKKILALTLKKDHLVQNPREGLIDPPHLKRAKRVNVDFPAWMVEAMDQEADRIGITRQAFIKAERLGSLTQQASTLRQLALAGFMPGLFVTLPLTSLPPMA